MLKEDDFINDIWKKHDEYNRTRNKDKFFLKHLYRNTENLLTLKSLLTLVIAIIATAGATYAGFITYNYITKETYTDFKQNPNYDYSQDMIYQNNFYYKKVMTYEEYEKCKEVWNDLVEMNEEDFNDNFVVIVAVENTSMLGLTVSDVSADDTTLYIKFKKDENEDYDKTVTSIKISKNLDRDIIKIEKVEKNIDYTDYESFFDYLGSVNYTVLSDVRYKDTSRYGYNIKVSEGNQSLSGDTAVKLMRYYVSQEKNYSAVNDIILSAVSQHVNTENYEKRERVFSKFIESTKTNITVRDFTAQQNNLTVLSSETTGVTVYNVPINYEGSTVTSDSVRDVLGYFSK